MKGPALRELPVQWERQATIAWKSQILPGTRQVRTKFYPFSWGSFPLCI